MLDKRNFYINGQWIKPFKPNDFEVINPSNEKTCAIISLGCKEDVNAAVNAFADPNGNATDFIASIKF